MKKIILSALLVSIRLMAQSNDVNDEKINKLIYGQAALHQGYFDDSSTNSSSDYRYTPSWDDDIEDKITTSRVNNYNGYDIYIDHGDSEIMTSIIDDFLSEYDQSHIIEPQYADTFSAFAESDGGEVVAAAMASSQNEGTKCDICQVSFFSIHETYKNKGLEKLFLYHIEQYAKLYNNNAIIAKANEDNKDIFLNNGFVIIATLPQLGNKTLYAVRKLIQQNNLIKESELPNLSEINCQLIIENEDNQSSFFERFNTFANDENDDVDNEDDFFVYALSKENDEDVIAGGINASVITLTNYETYCDIYLVALNEIYRNQRLGSRLLAEVEKYAQSKGCQFMQLITLEWQAKGFYEKQGFTLMAEVPNLEGCSGQAIYCMRKVL